MKAFAINKYSKTEPLQLSEVPRPQITENEVLVEIYAAGLNQLDTKIKSGAFKTILPYKTPLILGHDVAGIVTEVGRKVSCFKVGDEIYARVPDFKIGTLAEYIAVNEVFVALKPKNSTMEEAASVPLVGLTVWQAFIEIGKLQKGQKVFIQAGSGGVGTFAVQLAKYLEATVATTTSSKNFDWVKRLGADILIDYKTQDFETELQDYDLVLNSQDTKTLEKSINITKSGGKVISISGPPTPVYAKEFGLSWALKFVLGIMSYKVRRRAKQKHVDYQFLFMKANGQQLGEITKLIETGKIKPVVDKVFPFDQTNDAFAYIKSGRAKGKVVVKVR